MDVYQDTIEQNIALDAARIEERPKGRRKYIYFRNAVSNPAESAGDVLCRIACVI